MTELPRVPLRDSEPTLGVLLHEHAVTRGRATFALQMLDGALMASLAMFSQSKPWIVVALVGAGVSLHGLWSVADLRLTDAASSTHGLGWRALRLGAAVGGVLALFALLLTLFGATLGTWIS